VTNSLRPPTPEAAVIALDSRRKRRRPPCPTKQALEAAFAAYAHQYGRRNAECWAAMRAHHSPSTAADAKRSEAEAKFVLLTGGKK
jgi:hypothetical protein